MSWWPCGSSNNATPATPTPTVPLNDPSRWTWLYSPGLTGVSPASPGFQWAIPTLPAQMHYLVTPMNRPLIAPISANIIITLSPDAALTAHMPDGSTPDDGTPGVHLYFQRQGDDLSGTGDFEFYRWWSNRMDIKAGSYNLSAILDPNLWTSVMGKPGTANPALFQAAYQNCLYAGMTFGGWFAGHGVALTAGNGTCQVTSFTA